MSHPPAPILWEPSAEVVRDANVSAFMRWLPRGETGYEQLWRWSVENIDEFWRAIWDYYAVAADGTPGRALADASMPGARWFPGTRLNYAEHVFRDRDDAQTAIVWEREEGGYGEWSWGELRAQTARVRAGLRARGVGAGDRVAAYLPNRPETVAAFLATASLGAIWSSCSPDFGTRSVVDRFAQIEPKVLLAVEQYGYGGKRFDKSAVLAEIQAQLVTLVDTVVLTDDGWFEDTDAPLEFERVPFEAPLWILYSSGTTGLPKAIVQSQGGILLIQLKHHYLHLDVKPGDRVFWFTTTGWMMWNFLVGVLLTPAAIILYDGNPAYPDIGRLWDLAERSRMTCFGTSAAYLHACMKAGLQPAEGRDLSALRAVGSTGSPLSPEGFQWVYDELGADTWLFSTSGGTDVCTPFVGGTPLKPVRLGELQCRVLGCAVEAWDEDGKPLEDEVGELVLTEPLPSMPVELWGDKDGSALRAAYFDHYPGVWRHGDWIRLTPAGGAVITGRSDSTINRGGIRMGTAEIYAAVLTHPEIADALVVDVDDWLALFVVLAPGARLDAELERRLARAVREECSPRHVPDDVIAVDAVPRTLSGKILEVPVKKLLLGADPDKAAARESLQNPEAYDWFVAFARERNG